jgi:hypothetical protein
MYFAVERAILSKALSNHGVSPPPPPKIIIAAAASCYEIAKT